MRRILGCSILLIALVAGLRVVPQRVIALQRAGLRPAAAGAGLRSSGARKMKAPPQPELSPEMADIVPIGQGRRVAG